MKPSNKHSLIHQTRLIHQAGFSLVEIMIGLVIGLLATLVIMQVFSVFETQKRTTTGTADAQTNGSIALYTLGRELKMAGYPLMPVTNSPLECTTLTFGATGIGSIFPVTITDSVASPVSLSDRITIRYGDSAMGGIPTQITAMGAPTANDATVDNNFGCQVNDTAIVVNGTTCAMTSVTALSAASAIPATITLQNTTAAIPGANLACLGTWHEITYRINGGNLERCDLPTAIANGGNCNLVTPNNNFVPIVAGIVNLQAQYGVSATVNSNQVTQWVDASGATWAAPTVANRNRIKAVRIAVVARNAKKELNAVTSACSSTTAAAPTGLCAWAGSVTSPAPAIDLSANDPDWLLYRYRVFETIIPLRNMIWSKDTL
ncbi:MAG: PilW family protein [Betaproteobacteria bacterium]|nr:PilW family protein [Betaproteobacteria bacterium]